jgi:hypothetical protein
MMTKARKVLRTAFFFASPECRPWSKASSTILPVDTVQVLRKEQTLSLQWIYDATEEQDRDGLGYITENPDGLAIFAGLAVILEHIHSGAQDARRRPTERRSTRARLQDR